MKQIARIKLWVLGFTFCGSLSFFIAEHLYQSPKLVLTHFTGEFYNTGKWAFKTSYLEILHNKEICHLQLKKRWFIHLSSKFYYKSGQWSADFITVVRVHKPSSCPTDYAFCFHTGSYSYYRREREREREREEKVSIFRKITCMW